MIINSLSYIMFDISNLKKTERIYWKPMKYMYRDKQHIVIGLSFLFFLFLNWNIRYYKFIYKDFIKLW